MEKKCNKCNIIKVLNNFHYGNGTYNRTYTCKSCMKIYARKNYIEKNGIPLDKSNIIDGKKLCLKCNEWKFIDDMAKADYIKCGLKSICKECVFWRNRIINRIRRMEFLVEYGGKCVCCGENKIEFLTLEHVKESNVKLIYENISSLLVKLKKLGWPKEGYEIRCFNCNLSKRYGVPCMHESDYKDYQKQFENELIRFNKDSEYFQLKNQLDKLK